MEPAGTELTRRLIGNRCQLVGDDLFVTNVTKILAEGIKSMASRQLDPGQAQPDRHPHRDAGGDRAWPTDAGYTAVVSHRSGETEDATIADLAVGTNCRHPDQDRLAVRAPTAPPSTTSCCASSSNSVARRNTRAGRP
jgi:hypothetical protein